MGGRSRNCLLVEAAWEGPSDFSEGASDDDTWPQQVRGGWFERQDVLTLARHAHFKDCFLTELAAALGALRLLEVSNRGLVGFRCTIVTGYKA